MKQKGVVNTSKSSARSAPLRYVALVSQSGTDAPTATVLENTVGTVAYVYNDVGEYLVTLPVLSGTVVVSLIAQNRNGVTEATDNISLDVMARGSDPTDVRLYSNSISVVGGTITSADAVLTNALFTIEVY